MRPSELPIWPSVWRRLADPVVRADHHPLAIGELVGQVADAAELHVVEHLVVLELGSRIRDRVPDRDVALARVKRLLDPARSAVDREEALELGGREPGRTAQLGTRRLGPVLLQVLTTRRPDLREPADGTVGQGDGPGQIGGELLHRLADPERRVRPERRLLSRVEAARREQQARDPLLDQLLELEPDPNGEVTRLGGDRRKERGHELAARIGVPGLGSDDQFELLFRGQPRGDGAFSHADPWFLTGSA